MEVVALWDGRLSVVAIKGSLQLSSTDAPESVLLPVAALVPTL
jgi:hypothetical protein